MAFAGGISRIRLLNKIEVCLGFQQIQFINSVTVIHCVPERYIRHCRKFTSGVTQSPDRKSLTHICRKENIAHKSSSSSSSSDSEFDENGRYTRRPLRDVVLEVSKDVTVEYSRGLPQITVPLPSRRERCRFTLKPITNTVGDFIKMLKMEDKGIDRVIAISMDDTRIAASTTVEHLLEENFKLIVNDNTYIVNPPKPLRISGEEVKCLSDIKTLVSNLYEALNVQEHNIQKEKDLNIKIETLREELMPLEEQKIHLDMIAQRKSDWMSWIGLGLMSVQFGILARLTWWEYSWDIMEPVTYFVTYGTAMAGYAYFVLTKQEYVLNDVKDRQHLLAIYKTAKKKGLDLQKYNQLREQIVRLEYDLKRLRGPLQMHTPKKTNPATTTDDAKKVI